MARLRSLKETNDSAESSLCDELVVCIGTWPGKFIVKSERPLATPLALDSAP